MSPLPDVIVPLSVDAVERAGDRRGVGHEWSSGGTNIRDAAFARRQALDFLEEQGSGPLTEREASDLALEAQRFARRQVRKPRRGKT